MSFAKETWGYIKKFIEANPDIKRIGLSTESFRELVDSKIYGLTLTTLYHPSRGEIEETLHYGSHVIYQIGE